MILSCVNQRYLESKKNSSKNDRNHSDNNKDGIYIGLDLEKIKNKPLKTMTSKEALEDVLPICSK